MKKDTQEKNTKLEVMVFTDPYCSWCWATEPMILTMMEKYRDQLHFRYVFGGLIKDFDDFYDAQNDIRDAAATKPHWKMVSERTGQPIDENLWEDIAPIRHFSTWPANIAAKAAFLQSEEVGFRLLRRLRRAALTERKIISDKAVYEALARETDGLDFERFQADIESGKAGEAFLDDLHAVADVRLSDHAFLQSRCGRASPDAGKCGLCRRPQTDGNLRTGYPCALP